MSDDGSRSGPFEHLAPDREGRRAAWSAKLIPQRLVRRAIAVELDAPETVSVGTPARFGLRVRNRLPIPVAVTLPSARLWGWAVDGVPDADDRGHEPPAAERTAAFGAFETRRFGWSWDGTIRRGRENAGDVWEPYPGTHTVRAYLDVADWETRGLFAEAPVRVTDPH